MTSPKSSHSEIIWSTRIYKARSIKNVSLDVFGRGGTSYLPVIECITANRQFRNAVLVYFTDGLGDKSIPKPLTYINLWCATTTNMNYLKPIWRGFDYGLKDYFVRDTCSLRLVAVPVLDIPSAVWYNFLALGRLAICSVAEKRKE